ncbi:pseudouridine synthase, partial [Paraburkholderia sp. SIMBA_050]
GERSASTDRPARRDDDARPRRAGAEGGARAPYRDKATGYGEKRSFGERSNTERRSTAAAPKAAQPVKRRAPDIDHGDETGLMRLSKRMSE